MSRKGRPTERSFYPAIKEVFEEHGAKVVTEIKRRTIPDFIIDWLGERWIVSIKIGEPTKPKLLKDAFIQYINHMREFNTGYGMIIFYPESIRDVEPSDEAIKMTVKNTPAYFIVLNPQVELRKTLPDGLREIKEILYKKLPVSFSLNTVITILRAQIEELMDKVGLRQIQILKIMSDPELFFGINPIEKDRRKKEKVLENTAKFLAAYIFLSQVLFLRYYCEKRPTFIKDVNVMNIRRDDARKLFDRIKDINYRPIFDIDVLDLVPEDLISDTFKLLFGLKTENIRYDLPGRLFHELMPDKIRKLLAAFYTRPIAAYLLAQLTIDKPDATVLDPACGSGTILTMAYRRKLELWRKQGWQENPHKQFCEEQIYGCDIMPFAVHLTNANLVAMDPLTTIDLTQIAALEDSLKLVPSRKIKPGFVTLMDFMSDITEKENVKVKAFNRMGETIEISLEPVDIVLMNPPFTKVERGIKKYIDTSKFEQTVGGEVGLWGHFIALADAFLKDEGIFGAVLPINLLRGRESKKVREIIFKEWLPLYIIKPSKNYGFSEYAEYRDILVIAKKTRKKSKDHKIKFCIIKKDLNKLRDEEAKWIAEQIKQVEKLRSGLLDIDSYPLNQVLQYFDNMMPFICGSSLEVKDALSYIIDEAERIFHAFPHDYFKEGYMPKPKGVSGFMFITRPTCEGRTDEAFLILEEEKNDEIIAKTTIGVEKFKLCKEHFLPSLRTPVGLNKMDVTNIHDYIAKEHYEGMNKVMELCNFEKEKLPGNYWNYIKTEFNRSRSCIAIVNRINPYSPNQTLIAFYSDKPLILANTFNVINEKRKNYAKAVTVLLNSIFFLAYFFNTKEESTGRYIHIRQYDLYVMSLYPSDKQVKKLVSVFEKYKDKEFPALREQFDMHFDQRYEWFWKKEREGQETLSSPSPIEPHPLRLEFDMDVIKAVNANLSKEDVTRAYEAIVWDMIITRGLRRD